MISPDQPPQLPGAPDSTAAQRVSRRTPKLTVGAVLVSLVVALGIAVVVSTVGSDSAETTVERVQASASPQGPDSTIYVHVLGAVVSPGLYSLEENARAVDAVAAAGGFTDQADETQLNLARLVSDGEQIYVPKVGEVPHAAAGVAGTIGGKVNVNTADSATLQTLPRIGPAMAARIIAWRNSNGRFSSIDELRNVSGIGEKTFAALGALVTI